MVSVALDVVVVVVVVGWVLVVRRGFSVIFCMSCADLVSGLATTSLYG